MDDPAVGDGVVAGTFTAITLDAANRPHITYVDEDDSRVKYAYWNGSAWQIEILPSYGDGYGYNPIVSDRRSNPHIVYWNA